MALGIGKILNATGRGLTMAGSNKGVLAGIGVGAFGLGMANTAAPAARDAAFDFALGDPNADVAFTGRKMNARYLAGESIGGPVGFGLRASSPFEYGTFSSPVPTAKEAIATGGIGAAVGLGVGVGMGSFAMNHFNKGKLLATGLAAAGAMIGGTVGASSGLFATRSMIQDNQRFFSESPYARNRSTGTMGQTNAVGDIVLGMHNSRRGY